MLYQGSKWGLGLILAIALGWWFLQPLGRPAFEVAALETQPEVIPEKTTGDHWPAFRGPKGNGVSESKQPPTHWSAKQGLLWATSLPGPGSSSPEGLADYARHFYGPKEQPGWALLAHLSMKQSYKDSYRVTGRFLLWLDTRHPGVVDKVHRRMQDREFAVDDFRTFTGTALDALWEECVRDLGKKPLAGHSSRTSFCFSETVSRFTGLSLKSSGPATGAAWQVSKI